MSARVLGGPIVVALLLTSLAVAAPKGPAPDKKAAATVVTPKGDIARIPTLTLPPGYTSASFQTCVRCHADVHRGWRLSMHSVAWVDPEVQEVWRAVGRPKECMDCHLPLVQGRRVPAAEGAPAQPFEALLPGEGVNCAACHVRDGVILAPHAGGTRNPASLPPHPVREAPEIETAEMCAGCHQSTESDRPMYDTYREWKASKYAEHKVGCIECHMERNERVDWAGELLPYRTHAFRGAHSDPMLHSALVTDVRTDRPTYAAGDKVKATVTVTNAGAGHFVPSGQPLHAIEVIVGVADQNGEYVSAESRWLKRDVKTLVPLVEGEDTRLPPGGALEVAYEAALPADKGGRFYLTIQLVYHLVPPDMAESMKIPPEVVARVFDSRVIPLLAE